MILVLLASATAPAAEEVPAGPKLAFVEEGAWGFGLRSRDRSLAFDRRGLTVTLAGGGQARMDFVGAEAVAPKGDRLGPTRVHRLTGPRSTWRTDLPTWAVLRYDGLWDGVDLRYSVEEEGVEYRFVVAPGADPGRIRLRWRGAAVSTDGDRLRVETGGGAFEEDRLLAYQELPGGGRRDVPVAFELHPAVDGTEVAFRLGEHDPALPLVIDPDVTLFLGYLGAGGFDHGHGVAVGADGAIYVTGATSSLGFPHTDDAFDPTITGSTDAFLARISPDGSTLEYATFFGGNGTDIGRDVDVDADGYLYLAGDTNSNAVSFPVEVGPDLTFNDTTYGYDAFVAKFAPGGATLVYAGYVGSEATDRAYAIAAGPDGSATLAGSATQPAFPATVGPATTCSGSVGCGFVARVSPDGATLAYAGFVGTDGSAYDVALDAAGAAYLTGSTNDRATAHGGPDTSPNGGIDAFVAKVAPDGSAFRYLGFLGGSGDETGYGVAVDDAGRAVVVGVTDSPGSGAGAFPVSAGAFDVTENGGRDAFLVRVAADGSSTELGTFLGGTSDDCAYGVALDEQGGAAVVGGTHSTEAEADPFPVVRGPDRTANGNADGFLTRFTPDGSALLSSGFVGGSGFDVGTPGDSGVEVHPIRVATDAAGDVYVIGDTRSTLPTVVGPDLSPHGEVDAFVWKFGDDGGTGTPEHSGTPTTDGPTDGGSETGEPPNPTDGTEPTDGTATDGGGGGGLGDDCGCATGDLAGAALLGPVAAVVALGRRATGRRRAPPRRR